MYKLYPGSSAVALTNIEVASEHHRTIVWHLNEIIYTGVGGFSCYSLLGCKNLQEAFLCPLGHFHYYRI